MLWTEAEISFFLDYRSDSYLNSPLSIDSTDYIIGIGPLTLSNTDLNGCLILKSVSNN